MKRRVLTLKQETLHQLTNDELTAVVGGLSDSCVTGTAVVCATVGDCISDDCVTAITTIHIAISGNRCII